MAERSRQPDVFPFAGAAGADLDPERGAPLPRVRTTGDLLELLNMIALRAMAVGALSVASWPRRLAIAIRRALSAQSDPLFATGSLVLMVVVARLVGAWASLRGDAQSR